MIVQPLRQLDQVLQRSAEAVELGDDQLVAFSAGGDQRLVQLWAAGQLAAGQVDVHVVAVGGLQRVVLRVRVLSQVDVRP